MSESISHSDAFEAFRISNLPPYAKLFVAVFTTLMLFVCLWAMWMLYERKGRVDENHLPAYLHGKDSTALSVDHVPAEANEDLSEIAQDTLAVHAPVWDTQTAGREHRIDSADIVRMARQAVAEENQRRRHANFGRNLGLAHTHINGQTLLFFAMGLVFLFSSVKPRTKKIVYWIGGVAILCHAIGLTGQDFGWVYDDLLAVSGVTILALLAYMALRIYVDLAHHPAGK